MPDPIHPTNQDWELFDPEIHPPPKGRSLLLINKGGVLMVGQWDPNCIAWGYKPRIPQSVKDKDWSRC